MAEMTHPLTSNLTILQAGHPILRQQAAPIVDAHDPQVQQLIEDLLVLVQQVNGVGIAAPQVGQSLQVVIIASHPNARYPHAPLMAPTALINPRIIAHDAQQVKDWEGCLSVVGKRGMVPRYRSVEVDYLDRHGIPQRHVFTDFVARIVQHECDHLAGQVFLDRVASPRDLISEVAYQQLCSG